MSGQIRERTQRVLDGLPRNETFDWVERVSIELTTLMLATLFDYPIEERRKLTFWSDVATMDPKAGGIVDSEEKRLELLTECLQVMTKLFYERQKRDPRRTCCRCWRMARRRGTCRRARAIFSATLCC